MISELTLAWRYFSAPSDNTPKVIPRAGTIGLALSIIVLVTTLSVMNGFDRHIKEKIMSRLPHISSLTYHSTATITEDNVTQALGTEVDKVGDLAVQLHEFRKILKRPYGRFRRPCRPYRP